MPTIETLPEARTAEIAAAIETLKTQLIECIRTEIKARGLTQTEAAKIVGVDQPRLSKIMRGSFVSLSADKLFDILSRLGRGIEVRVLDVAREVDARTIFKA